MNKFQKAGLAVATASGMAFAGGSLWQVSDDFPSLQVRTPDVVDCWAANPPDENYQSPCYSKAGGFWFGYNNNKTAEEKIEVYRNGEWMIFGEGVSLSDEDTGDFYIEDALQVKIDIGGPASSYPGGGIGFNHKALGAASNRWDNSPNPYIDISSKDGYCITYTLDGDALQFVAGWDESAADDPAYAVWTAPIVKSTSKKVLDISWSDFSQDWKPTGAYPLEKAKTEAVSVKIRYNGVGKGTFVIYQLGWKGECDLTGGTVTPVITKAVNSNIAVNLAGRSLSLSGFSKTVTVQVLNLHGAVVATQTMESAGNMNLSNLPTGVYMVRIPALGYVNKVMLK